MRLADEGGLQARLFMITVILAGALFWLVPRPPMGDLAQIAGQVAAGHDLLAGTSRWRDLLYLNYFTPYVLGYGVALLRSFVLPVGAALKLTLTVSYYGFVLACVALRRRLGGDRRLDWLFVPGFFGFAYLMGFYTFLTAAPLGVLFVLLAHAHAERPRLASSVGLFLAGLALFFSHGLVFLFVGAIGGAFLLLMCRRPSEFLRAAAPYAALGICCALYLRLGVHLEAGSWSDLPAVVWGWDIYRVKYLFMPMGVLKMDWVSGLFTLALLAAPWLAGARPSRRVVAWLPLAVFAVLYVALPMHIFAANTTHVYPRFVLFFLVFYALIFSPPPDAQLARVGRRAGLLLPVLCWSLLVVQAGRLVAFAEESESFGEVLAIAKPGYRALGLILDGSSPAMQGFVVYMNFPVWYQAEKGGLVEFNFAHLAPQVVRYRLDQPDPTERGWNASHIDWSRYDIGLYRYFFVRATQPLPPRLFPVGQCAPELIKTAGPWSIFENVGCYAGPDGA